MPAQVRAAAVDAFVLRDREAKVLDLLTDSTLHAPDHAGPRRLWFLDLDEGADVHVHVRELAEPGLLALEVAVGLPSARVLGVQSDKGSPQLQEVSPGLWLAAPLRHGLMSVVLDTGGRRLRTSWVRV